MKVRLGPMAYFKDCSIYEYRSTSDPWPLENNIGWLGSGRRFNTRIPEETFLDSLWNYCKIAVNSTRGIHSCELCPGRNESIFQRNQENLRLGWAEIRAFSRRGAIFAAPNLIYHYVLTHHYRPPDEFVEAILEEPGPSSSEYFAKLDWLGHEWIQNRLS